MQNKINNDLLKEFYINRDDSLERRKNQKFKDLSISY